MANEKRPIELQRILRESLQWGYDDVTDTEYLKCVETAEKMIAHGVTVQEWISVKEPPKENGYYLCVVCVSSVNQRKEYRRMILFWEDNVWIDMANCFRTKKPLYWMPMADMPQPPKGE